MTERQAARIRQFKVGMLDYMAPEQVMGKEPGEKADLYSLGAVLYHLVTGFAPFQGESMVEVAKKHLQDSPPSPRSKRTDLPLAAEQVILQALSKRPGQRFAHALDLATAFRLAVAAPSTELEQPRNDLLLSSDMASSGTYSSYSLFDPQWRTDFNSVEDSKPASGQSASVIAAGAATKSTSEFVRVKNLSLPTKHEPVAEKSSHPLHVVHFNPITPVQDTLLFAEQNTNHSGTLTVPHIEQTTTGTIMKLTSPAKVVNVPVAGQPGRFLVGLLPVPDISQPEKVEKPTTPGKKNYLKKNCLKNQGPV